MSVIICIFWEICNGLLFVHLNVTLKIWEGVCHMSLFCIQDCFSYNISTYFLPLSWKFLIELHTKEIHWISAVTFVLNWNLSKKELKIQTLILGIFYGLTKTEERGILWEIFKKLVQCCHLLRKWLNL